MVGADREATIVAQYRTTKQFKEAWKIVSPPLEGRAECERAIVYAMLRVKDEKIRPKPTRITRRNIEKRIKKLRAAEAAVLLDDFLVHRLADHREYLEKLSSIEWGKRTRGPSESRVIAVDQARKLLLKFGKKPSRYRQGLWHQLAKILFGAGADLFEYLSAYQPPEPVFEIADDGRKIEVPEPDLITLGIRVGNRRSF